LPTTARTADFAAAKMERGRATDRLYLNYLEQPPRVPAGGEISRWEAVLRVVEADRRAH